ncbi:putative transcriptional regulator, ModE family [Desulfamplus magnetovallimortis]|uniref:Putative transcriptional regulator, ModE family n=1 Tax=Desulfamplus magnetovallimortis TaxID=1246637 RepID=A0A1W1H5Q8_9BACT|nr:LysR family transcriptional regulator [Desulfamplus magnetovallimortis]SLM27813.1 putative transcriptional regulator, ModE family [Desulfamplus magnetovallimortis]
MVENRNKTFHTRSKIWLEDSDGNVVFGLGRFRILNAIKEQGSLHAASKSLKMGYKAIWSRVKATEERLGAPLLITQKGGAKGGGSRLTPLAESLLKEFKTLHQTIEKITDQKFDETLGKHLKLNESDK